MVGYCGLGFTGLGISLLKGGLKYYTSKSKNNAQKFGEAVTEFGESLEETKTVENFFKCQDQKDECLCN